MGKELLEYMRGKRPAKQLSPQDAQALRSMRREAERAGATLRHAGRGGLPATLALHVFRRDEYRCKRCGKHDDLTLHHKGGIPASAWLRSKGHSNDPNNIASICGKCHDAIHQEHRENADQQKADQGVSGGAGSAPEQAGDADRQTRAA